MKTVVTITLSTDTNTHPQADENIRAMLERLASDAKNRLNDCDGGSPEGRYMIKKEIREIP